MLDRFPNTYKHTYAYNCEKRKAVLAWHFYVMQKVSPMDSSINEQLKKAFKDSQLTQREYAKKIVELKGDSVNDQAALHRVERTIRYWLNGRELSCENVEIMAKALGSYFILKQFD